MKATLLKSSFFLLIIFFISSSAKAEIVSYRDNNGNVHFVNTDYSSVPEEYRDRVKKSKVTGTETTMEPTSIDDPKNIKKISEILEKLGSIKAKKENKNSSGTKKTEEEPTNEESTVEVFSSEDCVECVFWETFLRSENISYIKYDINTDPEARRRYEEFKTKILPITVIDDTVIEGLKHGVLLSIIYSKKPEPIDNPLEAPSQTKK